MRPASGQVIERKRGRDLVFAIRFRAYGDRHYVTLGRRTEGWTPKRAADELSNVLADVRRGIWQPPTPEPDPEPLREERASTSSRASTSTDAAAMGSRSARWRASSGRLAATCCRTSRGFGCRRSPSRRSTATGG